MDENLINGKSISIILAGVKSIAYFFSAMKTQGPRKKTEKDKDKTDDENGAESVGEPSFQHIESDMDFNSSSHN